MSERAHAWGSNVSKHSNVTTRYTEICCSLVYTKKCISISIESQINNLKHSFCIFSTVLFFFRLLLLLFFVSPLCFCLCPFDSIYKHMHTTFHSVIICLFVPAYLNPRCFVFVTIFNIQNSNNNNSHSMLNAKLASLNRNRIESNASPI